MCLQEDDLAPPAGLADQMFYSTVSSLDRKASVSSDEEGDIYRHSLPPAGADAHGCPSNQEAADTQTDQDTQDRDRPEQVRQMQVSDWSLKSLEVKCQLSLDVNRSHPA